VEAYLADAAEDLMAQPEVVLLHGDLTHLNFLVEPAGSGWRISGLNDWGDARLGPPGHEFISPGVHMYLGDRSALASFYRGCAKALDRVRMPRELMARAMLYYSQDMADLLRRDPQIEACQNWDCIAQHLW
jgi:aminoglycoside phosphotransferase (APT) family kinase protein